MDGVDRDEGMLLDAASTATRSAGEKLRSVFERHDKRGRGKIPVEAFEEASVRSLQRGDGTAPAWLAAELDVGKADAAAATDAALDRAAAAL